MRISKTKATKFTAMLLLTAVSFCMWEISQSFDGRKVLQVSAASTVSQTNSSEGKTLYEQHCLACHAIDGHGNGSYPDIVSQKFMRKYDTFEKANEYIFRNMPKGAPSSLRDDEYEAITNYILAMNGIPTELSDIAEHWGQSQINMLFGKRYIDGFKEDNLLYYKPDQPITRVDFVRYLVKSKEWFLSNETESGFTDLMADKIFVITAMEYGIIDGYDDNTFRPKNEISRAEIAAILTRSEQLSAASAQAVFTDVTRDYWAREAISSVTQAGLFNGYADGTFRPFNPITRAEAAVVLYRLLYPE